MRKLGQGFADSVIGGRRGRKNRRDKLGKRFRKSFLEPRVIPFFAVFVLGMGALFLRLFWITLARGGYYRSLSEENRVREEVVWAPRGIIYDRHGEALVLNRPVYRVLREGQEGENDKRGKHRYLSQEEILRLEARGEAGDIELFVSREYPYGKAFAHVLGYVGEVDEEDVEAGLRLGSLVGKIGLEQTFDSVLRGEEGKVLLETDAVGKKIGELGRIDARPGEDLYTTLDAELQVKAAEVLRQAQDRTIRPGAVVASKPDTGEILVLYSNPSFDSNVFVAAKGYSESFFGDPEPEQVRFRAGVRRESAGGSGNTTDGSLMENSGEREPVSYPSAAERLNKLLVDPARPLFNRAISGVYPPGSTFKIITAAAGLEEKTIKAETTFEDKGYIAIGPYLFRNWYYTQYGRTEGEVDVVAGIARSVDTFFYKVGEKLGIDDLAKWGRLFGVGKKLGIEIAGEVEGRMPDRKWQVETKGERWYLGNTYHVSIGQGDILTTPLQVNFFTGAIANGGKLCKPKLIKSKKQRANSKEQIAQNLGKNSVECENLGLKKETLDLVKTGLRKACEPGGTGFPLFNFTVSEEGAVGPWATRSAELKNVRRIPVACKTGTAEFGDPEGNTHAWFTVFAPVEEPEIVVTVLLEGGGSGAYDAAPIARKILGEYFRN